jgi:hypothetical protein
MEIQFAFPTFTLDFGKIALEGASLNATSTGAVPPPTPH